MQSFRSLLLFYIVKALRYRRRRLSVEASVAAARQQAVIEALPTTYQPPKDVVASHSVVERLVDVEGQDWVVYLLGPKDLTDEAKKNGRKCYYLHGGAYLRQILGFHWRLLAVLATRLRIEFYIPIYPLAPYANSVTLPRGIKSLFLTLSAELPASTKWILSGDSAGGNAAWVLCNTLASERDELDESGKKQGMKGVEEMVVFSPVVDHRETDEIRELEPSDPMLSICLLRTIHSLYMAPEHSPSSPNFSPKFGFDALRGSGVRICSFVGTGEMLLAQNRRLVQEMKELDVEFTLHEAQGQIHCWMFVQWIPESAVAINQVVEFLSNSSRAIY